MPIKIIQRMKARGYKNTCVISLHAYHLLNNIYQFILQWRNHKTHFFIMKYYVKGTF